MYFAIKIQSLVQHYTDFFIIMKPLSQYTIVDIIWPYAQLIRFDKPRGTLLIFWPFAYGLTLAAYAGKTKPLDFFYLLLNFMLWAFLVRSTACTINDIFDRNIDRHVERTKLRPVASGQITVPAAVAFSLFQALLCIALFSRVNTLAYYYGLGFFPLITIYPLMKRVTNWPQAWLGVAANWGALVAWIAVHGTVNLHICLPLMVGLWGWSMLYDTIYACQDQKDDAKIGVGSTALAMQNSLIPFLSCCAMVFIASLAVVGKSNNHGLSFFILTVGGAAVALFWQLRCVDLASPTNCAQHFKNNAKLGYLVWSGMLIDYALQVFQY
ncbi:4-hydroxybenzoate polyprenyl transferase [Gautieria morchelliformis]|nr:4-hydroxybenzoate polyprenyl transferase [Gautieria morchelliformis]